MFAISEVLIVKDRLIPQIDHHTSLYLEPSWNCFISTYLTRRAIKISWFLYWKGRVDGYICTRLYIVHIWSERFHEICYSKKITWKIQKRYSCKCSDWFLLAVKKKKIYCLGEFTEKIDDTFKLSNFAVEILITQCGKTRNSLSLKKYFVKSTL